MVYQSRARKSILAIRRAPDGSAFQRCETCGVTVAIALADMHDCENDNNTRKKRKIECQSRKPERVEEQPRSAFHFFMEGELKRTSQDRSEMEMTKKAWDTWLNMTKEERLPFIRLAHKLNSEYVKRLQEEENSIQWVDDEADSAEVGKYDENYENVYSFSASESYSSGSSFLFSETFRLQVAMLRNLLEHEKSGDESGRC